MEHDMGYSYTRDGKLCCDICGDSGGVRKQKCPQNWCQPYACCQSPECRAKLAQHRKEVCAVQCKEHSEHARQRDAREAAMLEKGHAIRCSASTMTPDYKDCVKVWFSRNPRGGHVKCANVPAHRICCVAYMATETYRAIPLLEPASIIDYARHGEVSPWPKEFAVSQQSVA
jgi:hypothetical protein